MGLVFAGWLVVTLWGATPLGWFLGIGMIGFAAGRGVARTLAESDR